jgi:hypothetical protein
MREVTLASAACLSWSAALGLLLASSSIVRLSPASPSSRTI